MLTCEQLLSHCVLLIIGLMAHRWAALHPRALLKYATFSVNDKVMRAVMEESPESCFTKGLAELRLKHMSDLRTH